ncbi:MAG TPA: acyl-CoA thioesterase/bile acid-CoA:amino acid N-acyltransferase family protein [Paraburkholderia sp.]|nr:acyl-CoA thioesterase/bile acid-CoA:amino acid N-acyltransferase family protein [Paraburkholderia sp.]
MVDQAVAIHASGLQPGERVAIQGELTDGAGAQWTSEAQFVADAQGNIDTSAQAPAGGSYKEISGPGLIWSMRPTDKHVAIYAPPRELGPQAIDFKLLRNGQQVASVALQQKNIADGVRHIRLQGELHGFLFLPGDDQRHPGVLVVGGSDGGVNAGKAAWLAGHGYAALALAYFRFDNLVRDLENIPLEYFGEAIEWTMKRPEILPTHIGVMGTSRGGELALQLGSMYPEIKAVVAYVPANVRYAACCGGTEVPYAWTWHGQPLPYMNMRNRNDPTDLVNAEIPVERTQGPILMIGAEDDGVWESSRMVDEAAGRLKHAHFPYAVEVMKYPHAGHRAGTPEIIPAWHGTVIHPVSGRESNFGGTPEGDAASSLDAIPKVLEFLQKSLQADSTTTAPVTSSSAK